MTLSAMKLTESACQFQLLNHTKTSRPGHSSTSITIFEFEQDRRLCPLTALKECLDRTQGLRERPSSLEEHDGLRVCLKALGLTLTSSLSTVQEQLLHQEQSRRMFPWMLFCHMWAGAQPKLFGSFMISLLYLPTTLWHMPFCHSN